MSGSPEAPERTPAGEATRLAVAWAAALALLGALWVRSPFSGPGSMFLVWSVPALVLAVYTVDRLRRLHLRQIPLGSGMLAVIALLWISAAWIAASGAGGEMILDGLILRRPDLARAGRTIEWVPGAFGIVLGLAGLAAALEARYRLSRASDDDVPAAPAATRSDPA